MICIQESPIIFLVDPHLHLVCVVGDQMSVTSLSNTQKIVISCFSSIATVITLYIAVVYHIVTDIARIKKTFLTPPLVLSQESYLTNISIVRSTGAMTMFRKLFTGNYQKEFKNRLVREWL